MPSAIGSIRSVSASCPDELDATSRRNRTSRSRHLAPRQGAAESDTGDACLAFATRELDDATDALQRARGLARQSVSGGNVNVVPFPQDVAPRRMNEALQH